MKKQIYKKPRITTNKLVVALYNRRFHFSNDAKNNPIYLVREPEC